MFPNHWTLSQKLLADSCIALKGVCASMAVDLSERLNRGCLDAFYQDFLTLKGMVELFQNIDGTLRDSLSKEDDPTTDVDAWKSIKCSNPSTQSPGPEPYLKESWELGLKYFWNAIWEVNIQAVTNSVKREWTHKSLYFQESIKRWGL